MVDFNGIESTVKQNVVDNFVSLQSFNKETGKLTSTSFADVVKRIDPDCNNYRVIFPKDYKDEANLKAAKEFCGENIKVIKWADICDYKAILPAFRGTDYVLHHAALVQDKLSIMKKESIVITVILQLQILLQMR